MTVRYCPTVDAASPREYQWPCRSALSASSAKLGQAGGTRRMSNPQMRMHHLEPLPSRRARHEQKFWLASLSFRGPPLRSAGVHARPTARQTGCAASLFHDQMLRVRSKQAPASSTHPSDPSSNSMDLPTYLLRTRTYFNRIRTCLLTLLAPIQKNRRPTVLARIQPQLIFK